MNMPISTGLPFLYLALCCGPSLAGAQPAPGALRFQFRTPLPAAYEMEPPAAIAGGQGPRWLSARPVHDPANIVEMGNRLVLQLEHPDTLPALTRGRSLQMSRQIAANVFILEAPDALTAAREAQRLAASPEVSVCAPISRRPFEFSGAYAPRPTDFFFANQWQLERRNTDGSRAGVDLNVRAAWPYSQGEGVIIAVADTGVELSHPELAERVQGAPHFNFAAEEPNGAPYDLSVSAAHGTEVAGVAVASLNDFRMAGVAPRAGLASWVLFTSNAVPASDEQMMDLFQYESNRVVVQNHSWVPPVTLLQTAPSLPESIGISNALTFGRDGRGVIMVWPAGNGRAAPLVLNANDSAYKNDPRAICVGAVGLSGRAAPYSEPGACLLVATPSGTQIPSGDGLLTTDLLGTNGVNQLNFFPGLEDMNGYVFNALSFSGTSAAVPQVAGIAALLLSALPTLTSRDVQQILALSARHFDFADPDLATNGAGLLVSHNVGYGVPDAGAAVSLARGWSNRPPLARVTLSTNESLVIPDAGLRVWVTGDGLPQGALWTPARPSQGPQPDAPTPALPLVDAGYGTNLAGLNLTNKGALIQRGAPTFAGAISNVAAAGAAFAVVYNYPAGNGQNGGDVLLGMADTDFVPIPAVFIGNTAGEAFKTVFQTNVTALAHIRLTSADYRFGVPNTLACEHVGVRVRTDHQRRGDLRITLLSPSGTRSVLQRYNADLSPGPVDWTYYSTHHFFEPTAGEWLVSIGDEAPTDTGNVLAVDLILFGVEMTDTDRDGLEDAWEMAHFGEIGYGTKDDPDRDGYVNAVEQVLGTKPAIAENLNFALDLSLWNQNLARLSWPASPWFDYEIWRGNSPDALSFVTTVPGAFPETEWFASYGTAGQFYRVKAVARP